MLDFPNGTDSKRIEGNPMNPMQASSQDQAFEVLKIKCNVCHATKKKTDIFTKANMDYFAADIHKQVFVKQKMPKGRKVKLTDAEMRTLEHWLETTLSKR